jgi:hypothetical protein
MPTPPRAFGAARIRRYEEKVKLKRAQARKPIQKKSSASFLQKRSQKAFAYWGRDTGRARFPRSASFLASSSRQMCLAL